MAGPDPVADKYFPPWGCRMAVETDDALRPATGEQCGSNGLAAAADFLELAEATVARRPLAADAFGLKKFLGGGCYEFSPLFGVSFR